MKKHEVVKELASELRRKIERNKLTGYDIDIDAEIEDKDFYGYTSVVVWIDPSQVKPMDIHFKIGVIQDVKTHECFNIKFLLKNLLQ
jgi:hypothetical protein